MLKRLVQWHREWEDEVLAVLDNPALAKDTPLGFRRHTAERLIKLSDIERHQLREFALAYRGWRGYAALGKMVLLFCLAGLAGHFALPAKFGILEAMVLSNLLGMSTALGLVSVWFNYRRMPPPGLKLFAITVGLATVGALCGASLVALIDGKSVADLMASMGRTVLIGGLGVGAFYSLVYSVVSSWRNREYEMLATRLRLQAEQDRMARQLSEARLRLLQGQIEPHFLFNTLGAVQQLAQTESPRAADLTANLITFLRASLSEMRSESTTLAAEFALIEAYLKVMKTRLGNRLEFTLTLPDALKATQIPGMLLLTLVENAIKHGIEPSLRGGSIAVSVHEEPDALLIAVQDTGVGLQGASTQPVYGTGLTNVQERLLLAYGSRASLVLSPLEPSGLNATLRVPVTAISPLQPMTNTTPSTGGTA